MSALTEWDSFGTLCLVLTKTLIFIADHACAFLSRFGELGTCNSDLFTFFR